MIRIIIVDDHPIIRDGLTQMLLGFSNLEVIASLATGEAAFQFAQKNSVDIILMDLSMPGMGGIEATRKIYKRYPQVKILILSQHTEDPYPSQLLKAGAFGYLSKDCDLAEIVQAIRSVHAGKRYISTNIAEKLVLKKFFKHSDLPIEQLSFREFQVMIDVMNGKTTTIIASHLNITCKSVNTIRYRVFLRLGILGDAKLVHFGLRIGLIKLPINNLKVTFNIPKMEEKLLKKLIAMNEE